MNRTFINQTPWQVGHVDPQPFDTPAAFDLPAVTEWLSATVPGNIRLDLLAAGRIPDPFFETGYEAGRWVDNRDWWHKTALRPRLEPGQRAFVRFFGVDYLSAVFANGRELARHEGMFSRQTLDVTGAARTGRLNLAVRLWGSHALPRRKLTPAQKIWNAVAGRLQGGWVGVYPDRSATLKTQMAYGWDFSPPILTIGIWDDVEFIITGGTFIEDCQIAAAPSGRGDLRLRLNRADAGPVRVDVRIVPHNFSGEGLTFSVTLPAAEPGRAEHRLPFALPTPALWHPWDRGPQNLYNVQVDIPGSDSVALRFGVRSVAWESGQFRINGRREFARGLNWVPADAFPGRVSADDYAALLALVKEAGANTLRMWGGGLREKRAFYDLCDEMGILLWQEFPFACMFLGAFPTDDAYLSTVQAEVSDIVRQLDHHPAIVAWCGGNEFSPRRNRPLVNAVRAGIETAGSVERPVFSASPVEGDSHNWHVWHGLAPLGAYRQEKAPMLSEFGLQALPHIDTLRAMLSQPHLGWETHNAETGKLFRYLRLFLPDAPADISPTAGNLPGLIVASQRAQAAGLQIAIEHMRRRKGKTGGVLIWQFNEPWPSISWAVVDYFRRPKPAYQRLKEWFAPVMVCVKFEPGRLWQAGEVFEGEVWLVNDGPDGLQGRCEATLDGRAVFSADGLDLPPDSTQAVGRIEHRLEAAPRRLTVRLLAGDGAELAANQYDLTWFDTPHVDPFNKFRRWVTEISLR